MGIFPSCSDLASSLGNTRETCHRDKNPNGKGIIDDKTRLVARKILNLRNMHIHASNFIAGAILSYKGNIESATKAGVSQDTFGKAFELLKTLPKNVQPLLAPYEASDVKKAFEIIPSLSSFEWCSNEKLFKSTKREIDSLVKNFLSAVLKGDLKKLEVYLQEGYLLKKRALRALGDCCLILEKLGIL